MNTGKQYGFALGGGGGKAFAQLGAVKALDRIGIMPSYFSGSSMRAVNAILLSAGYSIDEVIDFYRSHKRKDFFRVGLFKLSNAKIGQLVLSMCEKKGFRNLEDLPKPVYVPATLPSYGLRITLRKGRIDNVVMASTAAYGIKKYFVNDVVIRKQIIQQSNQIIRKRTIFRLEDSCYSSNVPFELLDFLRSEKEGLSKEDFFDIVFDVKPSYKRTAFEPLNGFNKKVLSNDSNRATFFENNGKWLNLKLDNDIRQTDFLNNALEMGIKIGEKYIEELLKYKDSKI